MSIKFTKMHGLGNDFIIIDGVNQNIQLTAQQISALANRNTGIGFDQCLLVEKSQQDHVDFFYRIFNANGQEVGQCGNGARCLARFVQYYGLSAKTDLRIATHTTEMQLHLNKNGSVTVDFGCPRLNPVSIPLSCDVQAQYYELPLGELGIHLVHAVSVGNPHAIRVVENLLTMDISELGKRISQHPLFPEQSNAGFMQIVSPSHLLLRVYERGCGETLACGSGAVAAAVAGRLFHKMEEQIRVTLPGGDLEITWPMTSASVQLTGPASFVYEGQLLN